MTHATPAQPLAAVKAAISPLVYDGGHGAMDGPQVTDMVEEIAEAAVRALSPYSRRRTQFEYYDNARQNLISEHDCTFEDGTWWFGHGMECKHPELHAVEHAITYLRAIWMGLGEPTRNTPAGEVIAILRGERTATETQKEWAADNTDYEAGYRAAQHAAFSEASRQVMRDSGNYPGIEPSKFEGEYGTGAAAVMNWLNEAIQAPVPPREDA